ncbi:MAG: NAD(P)-binding protein, partial [Thermoplasmata archaeon]|nr:NAD(P)-binding protein [Thermoplasmata archaeon]
MAIGILGGGLTGLALAHFIGGDVEVLEKNDRCGGLCRTFSKNGFFYDYGG